jgi:hypothetical protein
MEHLEQVLTNNNFNNVEIVTSFDDDANIPGARRQIASAKDIDKKRSILNNCLKWLSGDYVVRQQIRFLLFPEGVNYDRKTDGCRTIGQCAQCGGVKMKLGGWAQSAISVVA